MFVKYSQLALFCDIALTAMARTSFRGILVPMEAGRQLQQCTVMCLSIGIPKSNKFSICSKCKINYF